MRSPSRLLLTPIALLSLLPLLGCKDKVATHNRSSAALSADELQTRFPWLSDTSTQWRQEADLAAGDIPDYSHRGCFPVGNGRVFTTTGLRYPFGTLHNTFGPTYQKQQGSLGEQGLVLVVDGEPVELPLQSTEWVMRAGMVHTRLANTQGVAVNIYDCVPPDGYAIVRCVSLRNDSQQTLKKARLAVTLTGAAVGPSGGRLVADGPRRCVRIGFAGSQTDAADEPVEMPLPEECFDRGRHAAGIGTSVTCPLGTVAAGESVAKLAYTVIAPSAAEADGEVDRLEAEGFDVLERNRDWWQDWYSDILTVECPDKAIGEFIPIQQHIVRVQQAEAGGYSPMYMYTTCWVRDSNGPIRFMTQSGKFEEVKRALDYFYLCSAKTGAIPMNFPLDIPVDELDTPVDWSSAAVERAETSSFLILQHAWYSEQSGDMATVEDHWGYLRRNLLGQQVDSEGRLPFHDDETYRFPGYEIFEQTETEPTDWVSMDLLSADSGWEYAAAAHALSQWANRVGEVGGLSQYAALGGRARAALDRYYWQPERGFYAPAMSEFSGEVYRYPFANICLRPLWVLGGDAAWIGDAQQTERARRSSRTAVSLLWKESGTVQTTPGCGYYVGLTPGMALWSLAALNHRSTPEAIQGVLTAASPSGGYAEMIKPDDTPSDGYWGKNRVRPWEGGINGEALVYALTGFQPGGGKRALVDPRLPFGWEEMTVRNLRVGGARLRFTVAETPQGRALEVTVEGEHGLDISAPSYVNVTDNSATVRCEPGQTHTFGPLEFPAQDFIAGLPLEPPAEPFDYGEPTFAGKAKTLVVTWDGEMYARYADRPAPAAIDTKIAFPPEYLAAALYGPSGKRRADTLVLDVSLYPGHCKAPAFWTEGEGKAVMDRFTELGGVVEKAKNPRPKPRDLFGA